MLGEDLLPAGVLLMPTAHASLADVAVSPMMSPPVTPAGRAGLVTVVQAVPFQRSKSGPPMPPPAGRSLLADVFVAEVAATAPRSLLAPGLGVVTWVQVMPFHRSISVAVPVSVSLVPAAHALVAEVAVTEDSWLPVPGLGLFTTGSRRCRSTARSASCSRCRLRRSDRPYVGGGGGGDRGQRGIGPRALGGDLGPGGAVPVLGERGQAGGGLW